MDLARGAALTGAAAAGYSCAPDHAERLLHTSFGEYLDWYSPQGRKARDKRPES